ncbi:tetraspan membrane protein in hair cell stereocilia isoform X2 [Arctopsyche grandis]|uniref:tetraspan membrane protein in hair cell stereocilia isoform X2 n=1 Tax=Arctopsyche grandis TaxID=121162 RepID=UPI00406D8050
MGSKIEYVESTHMYATNYVRNSKAIGVLWAIFTICYAIISVVAFITPEWIGDLDSEYPGRFGIWQVCRVDDTGEVCTGRLDDFGTIPGMIFQISTVFVGIAVVVALFTICAMLLFFFCQTTTVFHICGWMQLLSALCLVIGVVVYPAGWGTTTVQETCGVEASQYNLGRCGIRWAYLLAVIACLDAVILSTLAFILATRHVRLQPDSNYPSSEVNNAYVTDAMSMTGSRKSLSLQPVLLMQPAPLDVDTYSQFSNRTGRSKMSTYNRGDYPSGMHNFHL